MKSKKFYESSIKLKLGWIGVYNYCHCWEVNIQTDMFVTLQISYISDIKYC